MKRYELDPELTRISMKYLTGDMIRNMGEADWSESSDTILQLEQVQSKYRINMWLRSLHRYGLPRKTFK